jgi:hypothetical protein
MIQEQKYQGLIAACGMNCGLCIGYLRKKTLWRMFSGISVHRNFCLNCKTELRK